MIWRAKLFYAFKTLRSNGSTKTYAPETRTPYTIETLNYWEQTAPVGSQILLKINGHEVAGTVTKIGITADFPRCLYLVLEGGPGDTRIAYNLEGLVMYSHLQEE